MGCMPSILVVNAGATSVAAVNATAWARAALAASGKRGGGFGEACVPCVHSRSANLERTGSEVVHSTIWSEAWAPKLQIGNSILSISLICLRIIMGFIFQTASVLTPMMVKGTSDMRATRAVSVWRPHGHSAPFSAPLPLPTVGCIFQYSHATAAQTLLLCKEPTQRSGRVVLYASLRGAVSAGRGVLDEHVHRAASSIMLM